jgi:iron complex outermembrane receptor protein
MYSAYAEWLLPFTSKFEADLAARYDNYDDFGNSFVPKVSLRFQPLDNLTFRASYGEGFRAPPLSIKNQLPAFSADRVVDTATAASWGVASGGALQINALRVGTFGLLPEESKQWSAGVVYDPANWVSLKLDYYNIHITNKISFISAQAVVNRTGLGQYLPDNLYVTRDPTDDAIIEVRAGYTNEGFYKATGFDFNTVTKFDLGRFGALHNNLMVSYIGKSESGGLSGSTDFAGTNGSPRWRAVLVNQWQKGDFSLAWTLNAMQQTNSYYTELLAEYGYSCQDTVDFGYERPGMGNPCKRLWLTHDLSASLKTSWGGKFTIGAINLTNKKPPSDAAYGVPYYNGELYPGYGREVYFRYTQNW